MEDNTEFTESFLSDQKLLAEYRAGDAKAFGVLYEKYERLAFVQAFKYVKTHPQAEDVVYEAFTKIMETIRRGKGPTVSMQHYLMSTVRAVAVSSLRKSEHEQVDDPQEIAKLFEAETFHDEGDTAGWLIESFNSLDEKSQRVIWLRVVEGLKSREIAKIIGTYPVAVTRLYQTAIHNFRDRFVVEAVADSFDEGCADSLSELRELAAGRGSAGSVHVENCPRCSIVARRLRGTDRALLSIVFLAGLGTLAAESLKPTAAGAASSWLAGLAPVTKTALIAVPIVLTAAAGLMITQPWSSASTQGGASDTIVLGDMPVGNEAVLLRAGNCELVRESIAGEREMWKLTDDASCTARVQRFSTGPGEPVQTLDVTLGSTLRAVEVGSAARYTASLTEGETGKQEELSVLVR